MAKKIALHIKPESDSLEQTKTVLRSLRPFGIRFETVHSDDTGVSVSAWIEDKEPKPKKERQALGSAIPESSVGLGA